MSTLPATSTAAVGSATAHQNTTPGRRVAASLTPAATSPTYEKDMSP
jgi:hypothetical protein